MKNYAQWLQTEGHAYSATIDGQPFLPTTLDAARQQIYTLNMGLSDLARELPEAREQIHQAVQLLTRAEEMLLNSPADHLR